jgi:hypothetical protein
MRNLWQLFETGELFPSLFSIAVLTPRRSEAKHPSGMATGWVLLQA